MIVFLVAVPFDSCGLALGSPIHPHLDGVIPVAVEARRDSLWFSFNFDISIICFIMFCMSAARLGAVDRRCRLRRLRIERAPATCAHIGRIFLARRAAKASFEPRMKQRAQSLQ